MKREKKLGIRRKNKEYICEFRMKIERLEKMIENGIGMINPLSIIFQPS